MEELCHHQTLVKDASMWCMVLCKCVFTDPVRTPEPGVHSDISKGFGVGGENHNGYREFCTLKL